MGWTEVMEELEEGLEGTLRGTYRPLDNMPFFRVQYPPEEEREALHQFTLLAERLRQRGLQVEVVSLTECFKRALMRLLNCSEEELPDLLKEREQKDRSEFQQKLSDYLPEEIAALLKKRLAGIPGGGCAILQRMGSLYPFLRTSTMLSLLENEISCVIILPYPGTQLGALLDAPPADPHGGYYRGDIIMWK